MNEYVTTILQRARQATYSNCRLSLLVYVVPQSGWNDLAQDPQNIDCFGSFSTAEAIPLHSPFPSFPLLKESQSSSSKFEIQVA
jgi:hypothetical protein